MTIRTYPITFDDASWQTGVKELAALAVGTVIFDAWLTVETAWDTPATPLVSLFIGPSGFASGTQIAPTWPLAWEPVTEGISRPHPVAKSLLRGAIESGEMTPLEIVSPVSLGIAGDAGIVYPATQGAATVHVLAREPA